MGKKYHDAEWLYEQYHTNGKTLKEIGDECGVTGTTISEWMDKHGIERRNQQEAQRPDKPYANEDWLWKEYADNGRSMHDIADECGVSAAIILKWLRRFEIPTRGSAEHLQNGAAAYFAKGGEVGDIPGPYMIVASSVTKDGEREHDRVYVHQLIAIAEGADPYKVFSDGDYHCHHKNGIRWDNRPENIEFTTGSDHLYQHSQERVRTDTGEWE